MGYEMTAGGFPPGRGSQLTPAERAEIQQLSLVEGLSRSEIARRTRRDRETVRNVLAAEDTKQFADQLASDARDEVVQLLRRTATRAAADWIEASAVAKTRGDHRPARDLLLHARVIDPVVTEPVGVSKVAIVIGMPGHPVSAELIPSGPVSSDDDAG